MVNAVFTFVASAVSALSTCGTIHGSTCVTTCLSRCGTAFGAPVTGIIACGTGMALLRAPSYPPGRPESQRFGQPLDLAVVAELVDAQR